MKKKTGMTIVELLVSITMLIVATGIMYGLMINLQKKKNEVDAKTSDLITIADIEKTFQDVVMGYCDYGREALSQMRTGIAGANNNIITITLNGGQIFRIGIDINNKKNIFLEDYTKRETIRQWSLKEECKIEHWKVVSTEGKPDDYTRLIVIKCGDNYIKIPMIFLNVVNKNP